MTIEELVDAFLSIKIPYGTIHGMLVLDGECCYADHPHECSRGCDQCWGDFLVEKLKEKLKGEEVHLQLSNGTKARKVFEV